MKPAAPVTSIFTYSFLRNHVVVVQNILVILYLLKTYISTNKAFSLSVLRSIKMKKITVFILTLFMAASMLSACSSSDSKPSAGQDADTSGVENEVDPNSEIFVQPDGNGIRFEQETEGLIIEKVKSDPGKYFGSWKATSDKAMYLYGNVDITVNEDGTWKGNITEEDLQGSWEDKGDHLHLTSDLFSFDLAFDKDGTLFLIETGQDSTFNTVLTKQ